MSKFSRRAFLASVPVAASLTAFAVANQSGKSPLAPFRILFQGDSITDGNRGRDADPNHILGHGYAFAIASDLGFKFPERNLEFINKGVSGDMVSDLKARWNTDTVDIKPDLISILIGINDVLRYIGSETSFDVAGFARQFSELLAETLRALPAVQLVIGEPFILPVGMVLKQRSRWTETMGAVQEIVKRVAREHSAVFLPYQSAFERACRRAPAAYWIWDGIHPTYAGHGVMKELWLEKVSRHVPRLRES